MIWRLLDLGLRDPYEGDPLKEVLPKALKMNLIPETLCFYVPRRYAWIGRRANLEKQINQEYCHKEGIPIVRGPTGGGGGWHDGNVLHCILASREKSPRLAVNFIDEGLRSMGLEPEIRPKSNDILLNGKKVAGTFLSVGVIMLDFDHDLCERVLLPRDHPVSHREWITSLKEQLGREVAFSEVISAIKQVFETELTIEFEVSNYLTEAEERILEDLQVKYRSDEWLKYGKWSPVKDYWRPK